MKPRYLTTTATLSVLFVLFIAAAPHAYAQTPCANDDYACIAAQQAQSAQSPAPIVQSSNPGPLVQSSNPGTTQTSGGTNTLLNPLNVSSLPALLSIVLAAMVQIGGIVLVIAFVWVGFKFVLAQGKPEALAKARSALVWTIIGAAILLGAQALSTVIQSTVNTL